MSRKGSNVKVTSKECRGNTERMIRRFIKKCKKEKVVEQVIEGFSQKKPLRFVRQLFDPFFPEIAEVGSSLDSIPAIGSTFVILLSALFRRADR